MDFEGVLLFFDVFGVGFGFFWNERSSGIWFDVSRVF